MLTCSLETLNTCSCEKTDAYLYTHTRSTKENVFGYGMVYNTYYKHYGVIYIPSAKIALKVTPEEFDKNDKVKKWKGCALDSDALLQFFNKRGMDLSKKTHTLVAADLAEKIKSLQPQDDPLIQKLANMFFKYHCDEKA